MNPTKRCLKGLAVASILLAVAARANARAIEPQGAVTIAFLGDTHFARNTPAIYRLIKAEGADAVINGGDLTYDETPTGPVRFEQLINDELGLNFPYFATVGNHDGGEWRGSGGYSERLAARLRRIGLEWEGDLGVQSSLFFRGIQILQTAPGLHELPDADTDGARHASYVEEKADEGNAVWRISSFHRNMNEMQLGLKGCTKLSGLFGRCTPNPADRTGWEIYEASRRAGAIIATAHEHSYSRSHILSNVENQVFHLPTNVDGNGRATLIISADDPFTGEDEGRSFVFVSGLGGKEIRDQNRDGAWWAARYTSHQEGRDGVLFGVFGYGGDPRLAYFYFKDRAGVTVDEFLVRSHVGGDATLAAESLGAGMVHLDPPGERYDFGTDVTLTAHPASGDPGDFVGWEGDLTGGDPTGAVRVDEDLRVRAVFARSLEVVGVLDHEDDDAEEDDDGDVDTGSEDLDLEPDRWIALRYALDVPAGARVLSSFVQFTAEDVDSSRSIVRIYAEDTEDSRPFDEGVERDLSGRPTGSPVRWDVGLWLEGQAGQFERTPDLSPLVQQVVDRPGWSAGNSLSLLFQFLGETGQRDAVSADDEEELAAKLHVRYVPGTN